MRSGASRLDSLANAKHVVPQGLGSECHPRLVIGAGNNASIQRRTNGELKDIVGPSNPSSNVLFELLLGDRAKVGVDTGIAKAIVVDHSVHIVIGQDLFHQTLFIVLDFGVVGIDHQRNLLIGSLADLYKLRNGTEPELRIDGCLVLEECSCPSFSDEDAALDRHPGGRNVRRLVAGGYGSKPIERHRIHVGRALIRHRIAIVVRTYLICTHGIRVKDGVDGIVVVVDRVRRDERFVKGGLPIGLGVTWADLEVSVTLAKRVERNRQEKSRIFALGDHGG